MVTLQGVREVLAEGVPLGKGEEDNVRRQWWAALATVQDDLLLASAPEPGLWLAAPLPALYEPSLLRSLSGWVWAPSEIDRLFQPRAPQLPVTPGFTGQTGAAAASPDLSGGYQRMALDSDDGTDPLLVVITPRLQVGLALEGPAGGRRLLVRFEAQVLRQALELLDRRLQREDPAAARTLLHRLQDLGPLRNDPAMGTRFWPLLAQRLAAMAPSVTLQPLAETASGDRPADSGSTELALLEALTHEVRTPLATIRTLIRSLLRRRELPAVVRQRLEQIDGECTEQIDRFGLIFLAAEQQRQSGDSQPLADAELARTDLSELLRQLEDFWRRQLDRRGLSLALLIAPDLPPVLSDPSKLETMLGGLMDRFSRSLPSGAEVHMSLLPAGSRLKLRIGSVGSGLGPSSDGRDKAAAGVEPAPERVGPVLSWHPGTGSLQLSRQATRQLFHRLGGRLTERGGDSLTVFFPVC